MIVNCLLLVASCYFLFENFVSNYLSGVPVNWLEKLKFKNKISLFIVSSMVSMVSGKPSDKQKLENLLSSHSFTNRSVVEVKATLAQVSTRSQKWLQCAINQGPFGCWDKFFFFSFLFTSAYSLLPFFFVVVAVFLYIRFIHLFWKLVCYCQLVWSWNNKNGIMIKNLQKRHFYTLIVLCIYKAWPDNETPWNEWRSTGRYVAMFWR